MDQPLGLSGLGAEVERHLLEAIEDLERLWQRRLVAVFLYGSAARGDFIPERSDLNLLIVLQSIKLDDLGAAAKLFHRWNKLRIAPLFLTSGELRHATQVFPLELADIKDSGRLLYGSNLLDAIHIEADHVRAQCRRELHARLIRLRQEYLELGDRRNALAGILTGALTSLLPVCRAVLRLGGTPVPITDAAVVEAIVAKHHLDRDLFTSLLGHKRGSRQLATADLEGLLSRLLVEWERVMALVDAT